MEHIGEFVHIDCHYLSKGITIEPYPRLYLVGIIDGYSRVAWVEVIQDTKALTVMFAVLKSINLLKQRYGIEAVLSVNRP